MIKVLKNKTQIIFKKIKETLDIGIDNLILVKFFFTFLFLRSWDLNNSQSININEALFSNATINGINIHLRNENFIYLISMFILVFFICNIIFNFISLKSKKTSDCTKAYHYIDIISKFSIALIVMDIFAIKENNTAFTSIIPNGILLSLISIILLFTYQIINLFKEVSLKNFILNITIFSLIIFYVELRFKGNLLTIYNIGLLLAMHILIYVPIFYAEHKKNLNEIIYNNLKIFSLLPLSISLIVELLNIQIYRKLNFFDKTFAVDIVYTIFLVVFFLLSKFKISLHIFNRYATSFIILSLISFTLSPNYLIEVIKIDNFETANHSISIYEYFSRGKIPMLETFDAHFLNYTIWGILYGFITKDIPGSIYIPYLFIGTILGIFILFKIFSKIYDELKSALFILIFPVYSEIFYTPNYQSVSYFINLSMLPLLTAYYVMKNPKIKIFLLFWISIFFSISYRLDLGFAYSISSIIMVFIFFVYKKQEILKLIYSGIIIFILFSGSIVLISYFKNVNLLIRVQEILGVLTSNQFFGYTTLGLRENTYPLFALVYFVLPIGTSFLLIKMLSLYAESNIEEKVKILLISFFGISYLLNFSRSLIRHSLVENAISLLLFTSILFIPLAISYIYYKNRIEKFLYTYLIILIVVHSLINIKFNNLLIENFAKKIANTSYLDNKRYKTRIEIPNDILLAHSKFRELRLVINKPYSFINFTNYPVLHEVTDLESTSYINQFPLLLTSEKMQNIYIKSIMNNNKIKFAVTENYCASLDSVNFHILYFNISEYINRNFVPKFKVNNFTIWVKKDFVEDSYFTKREFNITQTNVLDPTCNFKNINNLGYGPFIFHNNFTTGKKVSIKNFTNIKNSYLIPKDELKIDTKYSYFIQIKASANKESELVFNLKNKNEENLSTYILKILKGKDNTYLIPISSNYNWFSNNLNHIDFNFSDSEIEIADINIITTEPKYE